MKRFRLSVAAGLGAVFILSIIGSGCNLQPGNRKPRTTMFIGVDASGSFHETGDYDHALTFLSYYIYGHLHELGDLKKPRNMFVAAVGGKDPNEPKAFHPIHDFTDKDIPEIEAALRAWFPPQDSLTDFNPFFRQVARIVKERNLILAPVNLVIVTDGVPDFRVRHASSGSESIYQEIDLGPLEYLSRKMTLRLTYVSPKAGEQWRRDVPRRRVRLWTVDAEVMRGWEEQVQPGAVSHANQDKLWTWIKDNVDYRVRSIGR